MRAEAAILTSRMSRRKQVFPVRAGCRPGRRCVGTRNLTATMPAVAVSAPSVLIAVMCGGEVADGATPMFHRAGHRHFDVPSCRLVVSAAGRMAGAEGRMVLRVSLVATAGQGNSPGRGRAVMMWQVRRERLAVIMASG